MIDYDLTEMQKSFEQSIIDNQFSGDDTYKLIFADWLDDHGKLDYSDAIRFAVEKQKFPQFQIYSLPVGADINECEQITSLWLWWNESYQLHDLWLPYCKVPSDVWGYLNNVGWEPDGSKRPWYESNSLYIALMDYQRAVLVYDTYFEMVFGRK